MNLAWGYDRFDDIWAGIFAKKIIDHLGYAVVSGSPFIEHRKASDTTENLIKEQKGMATNQILWKATDEVQLTQKTPAGCYRELAMNIKFPDTLYFDSLRKAMVLWAKLFTFKKQSIAYTLLCAMCYPMRKASLFYFFFYCSLRYLSVTENSRLLIYFFPDTSSFSVSIGSWQKKG